ncbi:MAG: N-acetylmuramoyl-L-alanine amidase [Chloroflexota bacterium]
MRARLPGLLALVILGAGAAGPRTARAEPPTVAPGWARAPVVGLQVGHWQAQWLPDEMADLRDNLGADRDGYKEVDANYSITQATAAALRAEGVKVDVLPATVPPGYQADAFVAVHADQDLGQHLRGYKVAASAVSQAKAESRLLASDIGGDYALETDLPPDIHPEAITADMRYYFAFNWRYYKHAIAASTPAAIIELGFITNQTDRVVLFDHPEVAVQGLANGILRFLESQPDLVLV